MCLDTIKTSTNPKDVDPLWESARVNERIMNIIQDNFLNLGQEELTNKYEKIMDWFNTSNPTNEQVEAFIKILKN